MDLKCKLIEKSFNDDSGRPHKYYVLSFELSDGSMLEQSIKSDKAKLLKLSNHSLNSNIDKSIWED